MKKTLLILLILNISIKSVLGQCGEGFIELKQQGKRDWVQTYSKLSNDYKSKKESISTLKSFFYDEKNKSKNCISFEDLQLLNTQIQKVFAKSKPDKAVTDFIGAIKVLAEKNEPNGETSKSANNGKTTAKTDTSQPKRLDSNTTTNSSNDDITRLANENATLKNDNELLKSGQNLWRGLFLGLLALSILVIVGLIRESRKKMREKDERHKQAMKSQSDNHKTIIEGIEVRNRESKNTHREEKTVAEPPKTIAEKIPEPPKVSVPEHPKPQEKLKQFYLSSPALSADGKGIFDGSETYNATSINALYVFNLLNDTSAEFKFFNIPTTVKDAIILPDRYLLPACEYSGVNSNATKIITTKAGKAVKDGNNWKITQKAEIRFE